MSTAQKRNLHQGADRSIQTAFVGLRVIGRSIRPPADQQGGHPFNRSVHLYAKASYSLPNLCHWGTHAWHKYNTDNIQWKLCNKWHAIKATCHSTSVKEKTALLSRAVELSVLLWCFSYFKRKDYTIRGQKLDKDSWEIKLSLLQKLLDWKNKKITEMLLVKTDSPTQLTEISTNVRSVWIRLCKETTVHAAINGITHSTRKRATLLWREQTHQQICLWFSYKVT